MEGSTAAAPGHSPSGTETPAELRLLRGDPRLSCAFKYQEGPGCETGTFFDRISQTQDLRM